MKRHLAVLLIAALAIVLPVALASAEEHEGRVIHGQYAFTGSNGILVAPFGFDANLIANAPPGHPEVGPVSQTSFQTWEGVYTFKPNGTGAFQAVFHDVNASSSAGGSGHVGWAFRYTVKHGGKITFTLIDGTYTGEWDTGPMAGTPADFTWTLPYYGAISPDGNQIIITWGAPLILTSLVEPPIPGAYLQLIPNGSFVLLRVDE